MREVVSIRYGTCTYTLAEMDIFSAVRMGERG